MVCYVSYGMPCVSYVGLVIVPYALLCLAMLGYGMFSPVMLFYFIYVMVLWLC